MARKRSERTYKYTCALTNETFYSTKKVSNADELVSLHTYYEMNPEMDDRPEHIKKKAEVERLTRIEKEEARLAAIALAQEAAAERARQQ